MVATGRFPELSDYEVDANTGFMAPDVPLARLPAPWDAWEELLNDAQRRRLQIGDKPGLTEEERADSEAWRADARRLPLLPTDDLKSSLLLLRRAHVALGFLVHFYVHTLPPHEPVVIPESIGIPMLQVSHLLDMPPLLTYPDTALYNYAPIIERGARVPQPDNITSQTTFTGTTDEVEFFITSARIELRGVAALSIVKTTMDAVLAGDAHAVAVQLHRLAPIVHDLRALLASVRRGCDPSRYYNVVRPWLRGQDTGVRPWTFASLAEHGLPKPTELSGPSAGQSALVHLLDVFLGVEHTPRTPGERPFLARMRAYMPAPHRRFLDALATAPLPLRAFVTSADDAELTDAYNATILALKSFRDEHMVIVTLYIIQPARRARALAEAERAEEAARAQATARVAPIPALAQQLPLKGTGGTDIARFLKDTRDKTAQTVIVMA
ncbi:Indoleamine 2,3-dioxygenase [Schizophyllum amplum]|uniref:Indoleamine 2,3-dioxygenase n=1 Tax=Schizophyllum amplum TaxID=97359 RepID=A0A550CID3_9AGAR|nr:Indoleamine 2,3-dioxygenase [Auriculariopsis ampla]